MDHTQLRIRIHILSKKSVAFEHIRIPSGDINNYANTIRWHLRIFENHSAALKFIRIPLDIDQVQHNDSITPGQEEKISSEHVHGVRLRTGRRS